MIKKVFLSVTSLLLLTALCAAEEFGDWPRQGALNSYTGCRNTHEATKAGLPETKAIEYCTCATTVSAQTIPWREFLLLDTAIRERGLPALNKEETSIMGKLLEVRYQCARKIHQ